MDHVETSALNLQQLPDDVLVTVLQYLDMQDVLTCRLVCKRLCGLALHRDVWRHRYIDDSDCGDYGPTGLAGPVLHLAPCLNRLAISATVPNLAVTKTRCAAAELILHTVSEDDEDADGMYYNAAEYALAVRNQEANGRLRRIEFYCPSVETSDVLLRTLASCSGLESLELYGDLPETSLPVLQGPPRPSLKNFRCNLDEDSVWFAHTILIAHAATLEDVDFFLCSDTEETTTAALLAALPRLESLRFSGSLRDLEAVAACRTLRDISIDLDDSDAVELEAVAEFFHRANQIRSVDLRGEADDIALLVEVTAWFGQSQLERLYLGWVKEIGPLVRELPALPALPVLRHLDLSAVTPDDKLLLSLTPATVPALRTLEFVIWEQCPHPWVHRAAVKATLAANTSLHILLGYDNLPCLQNCAACVAGCHQEVSLREEGEGESRMIGLFAHDEDKCPSLDEHTDHFENGNQWCNKQLFDPRECTWIHV